MDIPRYGKKGLLFNSLANLLTFCSVLFILKALIQLTEISGMNHMKYEILIWPTVWAISCLDIGFFIFLTGQIFYPIFPERQL